MLPKFVHIVYLFIFIIFVTITIDTVHLRIYFSFNFMKNPELLKDCIGHLLASLP